MPLSAWLCGSPSARGSTTDKIVAVILPISAFVAAGFEHSVANMYFIPIALLIKNFAGEAFWKLKAVTDAGLTPEKLNSLNLNNFLLRNLLPVTIGNIIGGALMVGLVYWFAYLRPKRVGSQPAPEPVHDHKVVHHKPGAQRSR